MDSPTHDCVGALLVRDGRVLLGQRAPDRDWLPGVWDLFGGHIEAGESPEAALHRELAEELGVRASDWAWLGTVCGEDWQLRVAVVRAWDGDPHNRQPVEHACIQWCDREEAGRRLALAHAGFAALIDRALG